MERDLLTQALIVVVLANIAVIGLALAGSLHWRRTSGRPAGPAGPPGPHADESGPPPDDRELADMAGPSAGAAEHGHLAVAPPTAGAAEPSGSEDDVGPEADGIDRPPVAGSDLPVDPGTGLPTAAVWAAWLTYQDAAFARYGRDTTVFVVDLVGVDGLADRLGTEAVERMATAYASFLRTRCRAADVVTRTDRGRFHVLLPETTEVAAASLAERLREQSDAWLADGALAVRPAIGYASPATGGTLGDALRLATELLHAERRRTKRMSGRSAGSAGVEPGSEPSG